MTDALRPLVPQLPAADGTRSRRPRSLREPGERPVAEIPRSRTP